MSLDAKNFDQHLTKYMIIRIFEKFGDRSPVLKGLTDIILDRIRDSGIKYINIDGKMTYTKW